MLEAKMTSPPDDYSMAEGEMGLYNVFKIATDSSLQDAIAQQDMLRKNAVLEIFFISDEDDVCFDYQKLAPGVKPAYKEIHGRKPAPPIGRDPVEQWTFDHVCNGAAGPGIQLEPDDVGTALDQLKTDRGLKNIIVSGAVYVPGSHIPRCAPDRANRKYCTNSSKVDPYYAEKEIGYGYTDLIRRFSDSAVDLAATDFGTQLADLGDKTAVTMKYDNAFRCKVSDDGINNINSRSFKIELQGPGGEDVGTFDSSLQSSDPTFARVQKVHEADGWYVLITVPEIGLGHDMSDGNGRAVITYSELRDGEKDHPMTEQEGSPFHTVKSEHRISKPSASAKEEAPEHRQVVRKTPPSTHTSAPTHRVATERTPVRKATPPHKTAVKTKPPTTRKATPAKKTPTPKKKVSTTPKPTPKPSPSPKASLGKPAPIDNPEPAK